MTGLSVPGLATHGLMPPLLRTQDLYQGHYRHLQPTRLLPKQHAQGGALAAGGGQLLPPVQPPVPRPRSPLPAPAERVRSACKAGLWRAGQGLEREGGGRRAEAPGSELISGDSINSNARRPQQGRCESPLGACGGLETPPQPRGSETPGAVSSPRHQLCPGKGREPRSQALASFPPAL